MLLAEEDKSSAIKNLNDGCKLLSDLYYLESQTRNKPVTPSLAKPSLYIIQDNESDESMFGNKISEKSKASKAIKKQGFQLKNPLLILNPQLPPAQHRRFLALINTRETGKAPRGTRRTGGGEKGKGSRR